MGQTGGARKGSGKADYKGVEGVDNNKPSGVNLSKLGAGVGKILSQTGAGAVHTNFKDSAGGAGGGMGSAAKTYGLGGVGDGRSLGLAGANSGASNFGSGAGGLLSGEGGSGGLGGAGLGKGFGGDRGRARANVSVPAGDPLVSGGLTAQEVLQVIRANLNQIRHCYEQLLQRSPNASGKVGVNFVVGASGRVSSASITDSSIADARMQGCITGAIKRWNFPQPRGGQPVSVNYPFVFNPI
jgi:TonB family protein